MATAQHVLAGFADIRAADAGGANGNGQIVGDAVGDRKRDGVDRADRMRMRAFARGGDQVGVAELAQPDEFVADGCGDQPFGKRVGRDGVDRPAATGIAAAAGVMRFRRS